MIVRLPLAEFKPDQTQASGFLRVCNNALPSGDGRYIPLRDINAFTDTLPEAFQGGYSAISSDGTGYLLAGTETDLYRLSGDEWTSLVGSLSITGRWRFQQFGDYVVAVNGSATREVDLALGTDSALSGAPTGKSVWVVGDYVCIGQANGAINTLATSAFRDHTGWTPGTNQATEQPFQTGGAIQGGVGGEYGVILQRERIVRQTRTGDPLAPFQYDEISTNFGCSNGSTIASAGRTAFFHSDRGFMALDDGQALRAIGSERVNRFWDANVSRDSLDSVFTAVDPRNNLVVWALPGALGFMLIYNFELDRWSTGKMPLTGLLSGFDTSTSLEALAVTETDLDAMTMSLDDPQYLGGNPRLYVFNEAGSAGSLDGGTLETTFEYGLAEVIPGKRARVRGLRPSTDAITGISASLDVRQRLGDAENVVVAGDLRANGNMPIRAAGCYVAPTMTIAAGTEWTHAQGIELECEAGGRE